ncbi:hypothetical protein ACIBSW_13840 [Actinoplanes sp. NPDC049668]|uniref:hypothetical protein n=1 Tax=unclassified Actinoplanes TaxID=2626549 RepID=UPI0033A58952
MPDGEVNPADELDSEPVLQMFSDTFIEQQRKERERLAEILSKEQEEAFHLLTEAGFHPQDSRIDLSTGRSAPWISLDKIEKNGKRVTHGILPARIVPLFLEEIDIGWVSQDGDLALCSPDGRQVELMVSSRYMAHRGLGEPLPRDDYISPRSRCPTDTQDQDHSNAFRTALGSHDPAPGPDGKRARRTVLFHVGSGGGECLEISIPSATMAARYYRAANGLRPIAIPRSISAKVRFSEGKTIINAVDLAKKIVTAFFFELAVTGRGVYRFHEPLKDRRNRSRIALQPKDRVVRFPPQFIEAPAVALFIAAKEAQSPLNEYLSYYQSVEYYLPFSDERSNIDRLRREIFSPGFDLNNNQSLLNLARAIGRQSAKSERESFRALLQFALPEDKATTIFDLLNNQHKGHFAKNGPIKDIGLIHNNAENKQQPPLTLQFAERIYDLRCRIVHSKVAGGSTEKDPLYPTNPEVDDLAPDIELIRQVAIEVITAFASPRAR